MRVAGIEYLISNGDFAVNACPSILHEIESAINEMVWPADESRFLINPVAKGNGVGPIKSSFIGRLIRRGWAAEVRLDLGITSGSPGPLDAVKYIDRVPAVAVEWETGNISSSHRALNKLMLALQYGRLQAAFLVLPTKDFYTYLTDRVGNLSELAPYFPVWRGRPGISGVLAVISVEHDATSDSVPLIPKGTDGRSLR